MEALAGTRDGRLDGVVAWWCIICVGVATFVISAVQFEGWLILWEMRRWRGV